MVCVFLAAWARARLEKLRVWTRPRKASSLRTEGKKATAGFASTFASKAAKVTQQLGASSTYSPLASSLVYKRGHRVLSWATYATTGMHVNSVALQKHDWVSPPHATLKHNNTNCCRQVVHSRLAISFFFFVYNIHNMVIIYDFDAQIELIGGGRIWDVGWSWSPIPNAHVKDANLDIFLCETDIPVVVTEVVISPPYWWYDNTLNVVFLAPELRFCDLSSCSPLCVYPETMVTCPLHTVRASALAFTGTTGVCCKCDDDSRAAILRFKPSCEPEWTTWLRRSSYMMVDLSPRQELTLGIQLHEQ